jgi:predicted alpha/beta-hydrolase family hydrolase
MVSPATLNVTGYRDEAVPNTFLRQDGATDHLAILLPGIAYPCDLPLLYYPARLLAARGADVLRVEYAYNRRPDFAALSSAGQAEWLYADTAAACRAGLAQRAYRQITLVGKSLGTLAMGHLLGAVPDLAAARAVWLTPLLRLDHLRAQIAGWGGASLFVIGTADPHYDRDALAEAQAATNGSAVVVADADHSLEIAGDIVRSLQAMIEVVQALERFLT